MMNDLNERWAERGGRRTGDLQEFGPEGWVVVVLRGDVQARSAAIAMCVKLHPLFSLGIDHGRSGSDLCGAQRISQDLAIISCFSPSGWPHIRLTW